MSHRIHILGASGSGTTTLGKALAEKLGCPHFDCDDYYWESTAPPYTTKRPVIERQSLLLQDLNAHQSWTLSGSLSGWGDPAIPSFDLVVYLWIPQDLRLERLFAREAARFGRSSVEPGGWRHEETTRFLAWASAYDEGGLNIRSRELHEKWLSELPCPILRLKGDLSVAERIEQVSLFQSSSLNGS